MSSVQREIAQYEVELKHLEFREQVLKKEKQLLAKFANHISAVQVSSLAQDNYCSDTVDNT